MARVLPLDLPPAEAVAFFQRKGLEASYAWQEVYAEEHARVFTVAKAMQLDVLEDIRKEVNRAISEGTTLAEFRRNLTPTLQRKGWWGQRFDAGPDGTTKRVQLGSPRRLEIIYDTNLRTAYAAGRWEQIQRTKEARPYLRYVAIMDSRTRPLHRAWHGTVLPADDPWWATHYPPNGWNCRCTVQQLSDRDLERYGYEVSPAAPDAGLTTTWQNPSTGEVRQIPRGIDPGFDYNVGRAGQAARLLAEKISRAEGVDAAISAWTDVADVALPILQKEYAAWARPLIEQTLDPAVAAKFTGEARVVGVLSEQIVAYARGLGVEPASAGILLEDRKIGHMLRDAKQAAGIAIAQDTALRLPLLLANPKAVLWSKQKQNLVYVYDVPGEGTEGMLAVEINMERRVRDQSGRSTETVNSVRTAGIVSVNDLRNRGLYDVVEGAL